jgi:Tol biopolymer transport system component
MKMKYSVSLLLLLLLIASPVITAQTESNVGNNPVIQGNFQKIAFVSKRDGGSEIYTINDNGAELKKITANKGDKSMPCWSPDGNRLFYLLKKGSRYQLWTTNSAGDGQIKLADECMDDYAPLWSPDSSKIVFSAKYQAKRAVFVVNSDGGGLARLSVIGSEAFAPSWSRDGSKIMFLQRVKNDMSINLINPDGTGLQKIMKDSGTCLTPVWSPDGRKIAYIFKKQKFLGLESQLYVMNADGSNILSIAKVSQKVDDVDFDDDFYWSPDGKQIAFTKVADVDADVSDGGRPIFIFTYGTYIIATDGNGDENQLGTTGPKRANPIWSPDSSQVAFLSDSELHVWNLKNKIENKIHMDAAAIVLSSIQWSPDGQKIIFAAKNSSFQKSGLFLVDLRGGGVTKLTAAGDYSPVWAPSVSR